IEAEVLVAEALHDLEVAIEARDHEELLVELRALGERVELAGREARRDEEVPRAAGRVLDEERGLELERAVLGEVVPRRAVELAPEDQGVLEAGAAEIEVAVLEADLFAGVELVGDLEGRRRGLVEDGGLDDDHLDLAGRDLRVHVGAARDDDAAHADDPFAP